MRLGTAYVVVKAELKKLPGGLRKAQTLVKRSTDRMQKTVNTLTFGHVGIAAAAFSATFAVAMRQSINSASDLQEVTSKFNTVFGEQTKNAERWSATLIDSYAMSTREAKQYLSSVQDLLVPMGMQADSAALLSNEIVKLSADLGSFNNLPTARVMDDMMSALVGNYETMKKYGVVLNATNVQQKALTMGLARTKAELTASDKAQAAYALMVKGSTAAIGDMARTSGDYANQSKKLKANIEDLSALMGDELLPYATKIVVKTNEWIKANKGLISQKVPEYVGALAGSVNRLADIYNALPDGVVGAAGAGLLGRIIFGAWGPAAMVGYIKWVYDVFADATDKLKKLAMDHTYTGSIPPYVTITPNNSGSAAPPDAGGGAATVLGREPYKTELGIVGAEYGHMANAARENAAQMTKISYGAAEEVQTAWTNAFDNMGDAFSGWAVSYSSTLTDMIWESELSFGSILESFGRMLTQMTMQMAMANISKGFSDVISGLFTGGGGFSATGASGKFNIGQFGTTAFGMAGGGYLGEDVVGIGRSTGSSYELHANEYVVPQNKIGGDKQVKFGLNIENNSGVQIDGSDVDVIQSRPGQYIVNMVLKETANNRYAKQALRM